MWVGYNIPVVRNIEDKIRKKLLDLGADLVGFASLEILPDDVRQGFPNGISFAIAINPEIVDEMKNGPTKNYQAEYKRINKLSGEIGTSCAKYIGKQGYRAYCGPATLEYLDWDTLVTPLPHKTVATLSGLGWIGRCALLVTEKFGSAVRLNTILTDAPLTPATPITRSRCGTCKRCVEACPVEISTGKDWVAGMSRAEFFDAFACGDEAKRASRQRKLNVTICGRCIYACPWTQKSMNKALYE